MSENLKKYRANDFWNRLLEKNLSQSFCYLLDNIDKKNIFKEFVEVVNLETSTKCNRHCNYCPLSYDNRGGESRYNV